MKTYRKHKCVSIHRTFNSTAKCMFPRAVWVKGEGPYATISWCRVTSVSLHEAESDAEDAKDFLDKYGCGGMCDGAAGHEVVMIAKPEAPRPAPRRTDPPPPAPAPEPEEPDTLW